MRTTLLAAALAALAFATPAFATAPLEVVTTTTDLAAIATAIGGPHVHAQALAKGSSDIHFFEAKPSDVLKIRRAKVFAQMGMELDTVWSQPLLDASRNGDMVRVDCSAGIPVLERPTGQVNRSLGDVHPAGNPHYQLDPENGKRIASTLAHAFGHADPADAAYFDQQLAAFNQDLDRRMAGWKARMAPCKGAKVIDYHAEFAYFAHRFGLKVVGYVEPKPGVPPTPVHTQQLMTLVREQHVKALITEQWYNVAVPNLIARETHAVNVVIPTSVGGEADIQTYPQLFDRIIDKLAPVLR